MNQNYVVYNTLTGEILSTGLCQDDEWEHYPLEANQGVKPTNTRIEYRDNYVVLGSPLITALKIDFNITPSAAVINLTESIFFSNIPTNTTAEIESYKYVISDGVLELTVNLPGKYSVLFEHTMYKNKEYIFTAK